MKNSDRWTGFVIGAADGIGLGASRRLALLA
jgi:hypothetical protein